MRIGIDARMVGQPGGIGRYIEQLLLQYNDAQTEHTFVLFVCSEKDVEGLSLDLKKFEIYEMPIRWYSFAEQLFVSRHIKKANIDLMHFPHWNVPFIYRGPFVVTIHDLIMYHYARAQATTLGPVLYFIKDRAHRLLLRRVVKKAKKIYVPTQFTKDDVVKTFHIQADHILVTYLGVTTFEKKEFPRVLEKPYLLYVGTAYPHKNLASLIDAYLEAKETYELDVDLVLAGKQTPFYIELEKKYTDRSIHFLGFVPDERLYSLYKNAKAFVFASLYEGFGLPPLEAMQCNIPVISSNRSCLPEVLGEAALYIDPEDYDSFAKAIDTICSDTQTRSILVQAGKEQIRLFDWKRTALVTLASYDTKG